MLEDRQYNISLAHDAPNCTMAHKPLEARFLMAIWVEHHGTADGGPCGAVWFLPPRMRAYRVEGTTYMQCTTLPHFKTASQTYQFATWD